MVPRLGRRSERPGISCLLRDGLLRMSRHVMTRDTKTEIKSVADAIRARNAAQATVLDAIAALLAAFLSTIDVLDAAQAAVGSDS